MPLLVVGGVALDCVEPNAQACAKLMARVGNCGCDIRLSVDGRQEPAHFEPAVRKRKI